MQIANTRCAYPFFFIGFSFLFFNYPFGLLQYFTDPSSSEYLVFRMKKDATKYFWTGERPKDSWKPTESVTKKYKDLLGNCCSCFFTTR